MNEYIDLRKILKGCPKGTILYSLIHGYVEFSKILDKGSRVIEVISITSSGQRFVEHYTFRGQLHSVYNNDECVLFPSQTQRDWSKFTAPWYNKLVEPKFKVGDKIVNVPMKYMGGSGAKGTISEITDDKYIFTDGSCMFISNQDNWKLDKDRFDPKTLKPFDKVLVRDSEKDKWDCELFSLMDENLIHKFKCCGLFSYIYCIPYNDDTKYLVGTTEEAPEYYRYWEK